MSGAKGRGRGAAQGKGKAGGEEKRPPRRKPAVKKAAQQPPARNATPARTTPPAAQAAPNVAKIGLDELMRKLADPEVPEAELIPFLTTRRDPAFGLGPMLLPNDATVRMDSHDPAVAHARARGNLGMGFLNHIYRARRQRTFEDRLLAGDTRPVLLAEGDSWFQYPVFLKDVVDHLLPDFNVLCLSAAGDELRSMVKEGEYRDYLRRLANEVPLRAMLISGGGNDVVGEQMRLLLRDHDPALDAAGHLDTARWEQKLADILAGYESIIAAVQEIIPGTPILMHGYDHARPLPEQGFHVPPLDGWVGEPMRARGIPDGPLQEAIVRLMIDGLNGALETIAGGNVAGGKHPRVFLVDNRGVVAGRWHDELHPLDAGFAAVAARFRDVLRQAGIV
jgi:hypothetical protein